MRELTFKWEKAKLLPAFYHTTFIENALPILKEQRIVANKGDSICKEKNGLVSLSDRITKGIIEFFGNVVFKFDAVSIYTKNKLIAPRNYGSSSDISKYDEVSLFENEWIIPEELKFSLKDIHEILLITHWKFGIKRQSFTNIIKLLKKKGIEYTFLFEGWLPDNNVTDMTSYLMRMRGWKKFNKAAKYV